jgi:K+ transporter
VGHSGLAAVKLGVVGGGVLALIHLARNGRARLARNSLLLISMIGLLGFSSNLGDAVRRAGRAINR